MRAASYNFETYSSFFDVDLTDVRIYDAGDLEVTATIDGTLESISVHAEKYVRDGKIPMMLGGEHSLTFPFVNACKQKYPDIGFVVLDAHMDLREEYNGEKNSHACISRHIMRILLKNMHQWVSEAANVKNTNMPGRTISECFLLRMSFQMGSKE